MIHVYNIIWDKEVDGEIQDVNLPEEVYLEDDDVEDIEEIADFLSDKYGWCILDLDIEEEDKVGV